MTLSYLSSAPRIHDRPPQAPDPVAPTNAAGLAEEWRTLLLPAHLLARAPQLARVPRGDGGPVIDIPGWKAPEASMAPLRAYLRAVGHDAHGWGLGVNTATPNATPRSWPIWSPPGTSRPAGRWPSSGGAWAV